MTDETTDPAARFVAILSKLPPTPGLTWHGQARDPRYRDVITTAAPLATSQDVRVATENFTVGYVLALLSSTGRLIAPMSAVPAEREVVVLPGTTFVRVGLVQSSDPAITVVMYSELDAGEADAAASALPSDRDALLATVNESLVLAGLTEAVEVVSPGKFTAEVRNA
jgi:hypothetical protein